MVKKKEKKTKKKKKRKTHQIPLQRGLFFFCMFNRETSISGLEETHKRSCRLVIRTVLHLWGGCRLFRHHMVLRSLLGIFIGCLYEFRKLQ